VSELPATAEVIVVGGGIIGCSVAYHLAKRGVEVLLLERHQFTSGSTWHAAGLVGQLRTNANITRLLGYSVELYDRLEAETGNATGWKRNGGLRLACNAARWIEVKRQATTARSFGLEMHLLSPQAARELAALPGVRSLAPQDTGVADMADTAEIVAGLDLVLSVDTAVAHLAGAMGKEVWVMLPHKADWRWLRGRADTPWYPSMRLFRQPKRGDWASVFAEIAACL